MDGCHLGHPWGIVRTAGQLCTCSMKNCGKCGHGGQEGKCAHLGSCPGPCRQQRGPGHRMTVAVRAQRGQGTETAFHHRVGWICSTSCPGCEHNSCVEIHICPQQRCGETASTVLLQGFKKCVFTCKILHSTLATQKHLKKSRSLEAVAGCINISEMLSSQAPIGHHGPHTGR